MGYYRYRTAPHNYDYKFAEKTTYNGWVNIPDSVRTARNTFRNCSNLNSAIKIGNNVWTCENMFSGCSNFNQPINIPNNVNNIVGMFNSCSKFNQLPNNINLFKFNNISKLFANCFSLNQNIVYNNTNVIDMSYAFANCHNLRNLVTNNNVNCFRNITNISHIFENCSNLDLNPNKIIRLYITANNFNKLTNTSYAYAGCVFNNNTWFPYLGNSYYGNSTNFIDASYMFYKASIPNGTITLGMGTNFLINASHMFADMVVNNITYFSFRYASAYNLKDASYMFANTKLYYDFNNVLTSNNSKDNGHWFVNPVNASHMFDNTNISILYAMNMSKTIEDASYMFRNDEFRSIIIYTNREEPQNCNLKNVSHMFDSTKVSFSSLSNRFLPLLNNTFNYLNLQDASYLYSNIYIYQDIINYFSDSFNFPANVNNLCGLFYNTFVNVNNSSIYNYSNGNRLNLNVFILNNNCNVHRMFYKVNNAIYKHIMAYNLNMLMGTSTSNSLTGTTISYTRSYDKYYYNEVYNIYLHGL